MSDSSRPALFILRISLGLFMLQWALEKVIYPEKTISIFGRFYGMEISPEIAMALGIPQILLSIAITIGLWKTISYAGGVLVHAGSTLSTYQELLNPYEGINHLFTAAVPVLAAFILLFVMRDKDRLLSVS